MEGRWPQPPWESWKPGEQVTSCFWLKHHLAGLYVNPQQYLRCQGSYPDQSPFRQSPNHCPGALGISQRDTATGVGGQSSLIFLFTLVPVVCLQGPHVFPA